MACELVTGLGEEPHISAEQIGLFNVALVGAGDYLLNTQDKLAATIPTANSITIGTGDVSMQGRHVTVPEPETLTIGSGTTGYNRIDLVVIRYTKDPVTGIEKTELDIIRGEATTGTPSEPSYTTGNIRTGGALLNELPIYRITISGITPQEPVLLLDNVLASLSQLQEGLAKLITTDRIQNGAVTNAKLADGSVNSAKIADGGVASADLANGAVTTAKIADGNVSLAKLASNSVNATKIVDGSVGNAELATNAVTTAKVADKNITKAKLAQDLQNSISHAWTRLWTGTLAKGASVSIPNLNTYKFIGVKLAKDASAGTSQIMLIGVFANPTYGTGSTELHCDSQSDSGTNTVFWKASFNVTNTTLKLQSASIHEVITSSPYLKGTAQVVKEIWGFK